MSRTESLLLKSRRHYRRADAPPAIIMWETRISPDFRREEEALGFKDDILKKFPDCEVSFVSKS